MKMTKKHSSNEDIGRIRGNVCTVLTLVPGKKGSQMVLHINVGITDWATQMVLLTSVGVTDWATQMVLRINVSITDWASLVVETDVWEEWVL